MVIRGCNHTAYFDLRNRPAPGIDADAGHCNIPLHHVDDFRNGVMMRVHDHGLRGTVGNGPQRAHTLRHRERVIKPRNRATLIPRVLLCLDHSGRLGPVCYTQPRRELSDTNVDALRRPLELQPRFAKRVPSHRVAARPKQQPQLFLRHIRTGLELAVAEPVDTGADPKTWRGSLFLVVAGQRGRQIPVPIPRDHGFQQIPVPVACGHHPHRHRHNVYPPSPCRSC